VKQILTTGLLVFLLEMVQVRMRRGDGQAGVPVLHHFATKLQFFCLGCLHKVVWDSFLWYHQAPENGGLVFVTLGVKLFWEVCCRLVSRNIP
jgi:hypothetical protein